MEVHQRPKVTPVMVLKGVGMVLCMALGFAVAFYGGYHKLSYVLAPCIFLEVSCAICFNLIGRYLKGTLFQGQNPNSMKAGFWLGCVVLCLSIVGCFVIGITGFVKIDGIVYREYGFYAALVPCLLAVFWSCVLIYDARFYWRMWQQQAGVTTTPGVKIIFRS